MAAKSSSTSVHIVTDSRMSSTTLSSPERIKHPILNKN